MFKYLLIAALVSGVAACTTAIPPDTETAGYGHLVSGAKFGAVIGGDSTEATAALTAQGFAYQGAAPCSNDTRALFSCREGETFLSFQPLALDRRGHVYLKIENGKIAAIGWRLANVPALEG